MIRRNASERRPFVTSRSGASPRIFRIRGFARRTSQRRDLIEFQAFARLASSAHGIGVVGRGATPQMAEAHGGRGGVGIRVLLPCVAAVPPVMHAPVYVLMSGYGLVKPSESVWRNATIWFSSVSLNPSIPTVMSILFGTSGIGQQSTFSVFPAGQCPEVMLNLNATTSRVL